MRKFTFPVKQVLVLLLTTAAIVFCATDSGRSSPQEFAAAVAGGKLPPLLPGEKISFRPLTLDKENLSFLPFAAGSYLVSRQQQENLKQLAQYLCENSEMKLLIKGYPDREGDCEYNMALAWHRALTVRKILVILGVGKDRLYTVYSSELSGGCGLFLVYP